MNKLPSHTILLTGFFLSLLGCVLPILMVTGIAASTLFLNFFSFTATIAGILLGLIGAATLVRERHQ